MQTVAIVGVGLIGSSFGLALRKSGFTGLILGVSSPQAVKAALDIGAISRSVTLKEAADSADLIYLAQPVDRIVQTLSDLGPLVHRDTLITDAGSTKRTIVDAAQAHIKQANFLGGHPMAGKETRGAGAADADLFRGRPYVLTPIDKAVPASFRLTLQAIGAKIVVMSPEKHDATIALTSHLPQLISTGLAAFLARQKETDLQSVFGSGLLDMTRLALSPYDLWSSILYTNRGNVCTALGAYADMLLEIKETLSGTQTEEFFTSGAGFARQLRKVDH